MEVQMSITIALGPHKNAQIDALSDVQRLHWILAFIQRNLDGLAPDAIQALGDDLVHAAAPWWSHEETLWAHVVPQCTDISADQVRALQQEIRQCIHALLRESISFQEAGMMSIGRTPLTGGWALPQPATHLFRVRMDRRGRHTRVLAVGKEGDERTAIMGGVAALLGMFGDRLCACPVCGAPFLRHYRQQYCNVRCSNKVRNRRRLARKAHERKSEELGVTDVPIAASLTTA
jgi:hypothetical protein